MSQAIRITGEREQNVACVPILRLRLRNGSSIGPTVLKRLWSLASGSDEVRVFRDLGASGNAAVHHTYVVSGPARLLGSVLVENNLRRLLQEQLATAHVELTRFL
jgi:hypothetical protein